MLIFFKVPKTAEAILLLKELGFVMIDNGLRIWSNSRYALLNHKVMNGVIVEVID